MGSSGDNTVVVGLIGAGIGASFSPALHEREAALLGFDYEYRLLDLDELGRPASDVGALVREAQRAGLRGLNITHPCKQLVVGELDELSPEAAALGAVNTVVLRDGRKVGHNTDASGFGEAFERRLPGARTEHVVLLGAGGAGAAVGHAILALGARAAERGRRRGRPRGRARRGPRPARGGRRPRRAGRAPTGSSTPPRPAWTPTPAARCRRSCSTRATGSPRSSTCRCGPSCCRTPRSAAAARSTAARWSRCRRRARSSCSPARGPTATGCWPTSTSCPRADARSPLSA